MDKDNVDRWNSAIQAFDEGELETSLDRFQAMENAPACVLYNSAVILTRLERHEEAIQKLTEAIEKDPYFAIALFKRGCIYFQENKYEEAIGDFEVCSRVFRFARHIDYAQHGIGGLTVRLLLSDATFNAGVCHFMTGNQLKGLNLLYQAKSEADARSCMTINRCLASLQESAEQFNPQLMQLPESALLFRPLRSFSVRPKDFLGSSKVIASRQGSNSPSSSQENLTKVPDYRRPSLSPFETTMQIPPPPCVPPPRRPAEPVLRRTSSSGTVAEC